MLLLIKNGSSMGQSLSFEFGAVTLLRATLHVTPPKEAAKRVFLPASFLHWCTRRSCDVIIAQKHVKQRVTSRSVFGGKIFHITISRSSVRYLDAKRCSGGD